MENYTLSDQPSNRWALLVPRYGPAALCALIGFLSAFTISIGGQMPVGELVLIGVFPWVLIRAYFSRGWPSRLQQMGWYKLLVLLAALMAVGYVASDLYRGSSFYNLSRGWARVGCLGIDLVSMAYIINISWQRLRVFIFSLLLGGIVSAAISGPLYGDWWKFGVGYPLTALVFLAIGGRSLSIQIGAALILATVNFLFGARSLGAICLLTGGLFVLVYARGIWRPLVLLSSLGAIVGLLFAAHTVIIENQEHEGSNVERQSMIETAAEAFLSSPLIGQGSWFTATSMISRLEEKRTAIDATFRGYDEEEAHKLTIHSQILVSLAEGGILGGAFFLGLFALILKSLRILTRDSVPYRAFVIYWVLEGGWDLLMSPFSGVARVQIVLTICTCLLVILQRRGELPEVEHE